MTDLLLDWRRRLRLRRIASGPLHDYLAAPLPSKAADYRAVEYLAVDLETTGLNPRVDQILSIGWVLVRGNCIDLASASHCLLRCNGAIPASSAVIHQITDDQAADGVELSGALSELIANLRGRVLLAHHAKVERGFLDAACRRLFGHGLLVRTVDTQVLARRTFERREIPYKAGDLRLHALCERYNLPRHGAHNAFWDALAAAELFLAQAAHRDNGNGFRLGELL
jgi:DNA polymerase-3 subunit epsilon